jgi:hypothetical protein
MVGWFETASSILAEFYPFIQNQLGGRFLAFYRSSLQDVNIFGCIQGWSGNP